MDSILSLINNLSDIPLWKVVSSFSQTIIKLANEDGALFDDRIWEKIQVLTALLKYINKAENENILLHNEQNSIQAILLNLWKILLKRYIQEEQFTSEYIEDFIITSVLFFDEEHCKSCCTILDNTISMTIDAVLDGESDWSTMKVFNIIEAFLMRSEASISNIKKVLFGKLCDIFVTCDESLLENGIIVRTGALLSHLKTFNFIEVSDSICMTISASLSEKSSLLKKSLQDMQDDIDWLVQYCLIWVDMLLDVTCSDSIIKLHYSETQSEEKKKPNILEDSLTWMVIQYGLCHKKPFMRKQALFDLRRALSAASEMSSVMSHFEDAGMDSAIANTNIEARLNTPIFIWDREDQSNLLLFWKDFILVSETLEENQLHVIMPVVARLNGMIEMSSTISRNNCKLHTSWICVILKKMLFHESKSIQREGVILSLKIDAREFPFLQQEFGDEFFVNLIDSLRDVNLFCDLRDNTSPPQVEALFPIIACHLQNFFQNCMEVGRDYFIRRILGIIAKFNWGPVPLYYLCHALSTLPTCHAWESNELGLLQTLIMKCLRTHDIRLRRNIQCILLHLLLKFVDCRRVSLNEVLNVFSLFDIKKFFIANKELRSEISRWFAENWKLFQDVVLSNFKDLHHFAVIKIEEYCSSTCSVQQAQEKSFTASELYVLVLLFAEQDYSEGKNGLRREVLGTLNAIVEKASTHLYMSRDKVHHAISVLKQMLPRPKSQKLEGEADMYNDYFKLLRSLQSYIVLEFPSRSSSFEDAVFYLDTWRKLFSYLLTLDSQCQWPKQILSQFSPLISSAKNIYFSTRSCQSSSTFVTVLISLKILSWICHLHCDFTLHLDHSVYSCVSEFLVSLDLTSSLVPEFTYKDANERKLIEKYSVMQWSCVSCALLLKHDGNYKEVNHVERLKNFSTQIDTVTQQNLPIYFQALEYLISEVAKSTDDDHQELICEAIDTSWKTLKSLTRSTEYWICYRSMLQAVIQKTTLLAPEESIVHAKVKKFLLEIISLSTAKPRLLEDAINICVAIWIKSKNKDFVKKNEKICRDQSTYNESSLEITSIKSHVEFIVQCLTFYYVQSKEDLALLNVIELSKDINLTDEDSHQSCNYVTLTTISMISQFNKSVSADCNLAVLISEKLLQLEKNITKKKPRYHHNSVQHRVKNKIFQAILLMLPYVNDETKAKSMVDDLVPSLKNEAQPSVRYYTEWILALLVYRFPNNKETLLSQLNGSSVDLPDSCPSTGTAKYSAISSYLSSALLVGFCHQTDNLREEYFVELVNICMPWCTSQHFTIRLYALAVLLKIKLHFDTKGRGEVLSGTHPSLSSCLLLADNSRGNVGKNWEKMKDNFFLFDLNPMEDLSFETVYVDIPRLCCIPNHTKLVDFNLINKNGSIKNNIFESGISLLNHNGKIRERTSTNWMQSESKQSKSNNDIVVNNSDRYRKNYGLIDANDDDTNVGDENVQKKIMPWMDMVEAKNEESTKRSRKRGLILVASLIDKPSNLGGLTRTCEIFGAEALVVQSLSCTSDKLYQSLSVTAHKWLPMNEVKLWEIPEYLMKMRKCGYTLIGTEQTAQSVCLSKYRFPVKCVVVLGNEKEGIPIPILKILDVCIQIPQKGIVRSLNVHVSGAITIWEYARQHLSSS